MPQWIVALCAVLAFTALAIAWTLVRDRRRTRRLAEVARGLGLRFQAEGSFLLAEGLEALPIFALARLARWSSIRNVMQGTLDTHRLVVCDYHYATGGPSRRNDYYHSVAAFSIGIGTLPDFAIGLARPALVRAALSGPLAAALGGLLPSRNTLRAAIAAADDARIELPASAAFAERYTVTGRDRAGILRALRPSVVDYLASRSAPLLVESAGGWLAVFRRRYVPPDALPEFLAEARELVSRLLSAGRR